MMKRPFLHAALGFALVTALWTFDALPGVSARPDMPQLQGSHANEDPAILARELSLNRLDERR